MSIAAGALIGSAIAGAAANALNGNFSTSNGWSQAQDYSVSDSGSYQQSAAQAWTDAATANKWASEEAEKNREYQTLMSNTAYQRAVADLKKAGLNPVLAAWNGGASSPVGTQAQTFMNSYSTSAGSGGSSSHSESAGKSESRQNSKSEPLISKIFTGLGTALQAMGEADKQAWNNAKGMAGMTYQ